MAYKTITKIKFWYCKDTESFQQYKEIDNFFINKNIMFSKTKHKTLINNILTFRNT